MLTVNRQILKLKILKLLIYSIFKDFFSDPNRTNFKSFYGRFKDIGLLYIVPVFHWLYEFGLDILLGIEGKSYLIAKKKLLNNLFEVEQAALTLCGKFDGNSNLLIHQFMPEFGEIYNNTQELMKKIKK